MLIPRIILGWSGLGRATSSTSGRARSRYHNHARGRFSVSKELVCVAGNFLFSDPGRVVSLSGTFLGEISDFSRRMGWSAVFSSCRVAALQACETSRLGPPPGLQIRACSGRSSGWISSQTALLYREDQLLLRFVWW